MFSFFVTPQAHFVRAGIRWLPERGPFPFPTTAISLKANFAISKLIPRLSFCSTVPMREVQSLREDGSHRWNQCDTMFSVIRHGFPPHRQSQREYTANIAEICEANHPDYTSSLL